MKKTLLLFTLLPFFAGAQQTYVPDDNFEAYLECHGMGNGIANDELFVLGSSDSNDYPTLTTAYSTTLNGSYDIVMKTLDRYEN